MERGRAGCACVGRAARNRPWPASRVSARASFLSPPPPPASYREQGVLHHITNTHYGAMEDDGDHHGRGVAAADKSPREDSDGSDYTSDVVPAASDEEGEEDERFTFAAVSGLGCGGVFSGGRIGPVYPVFGRPRSPPPQQEEVGEYPETDTATVRVPLSQLLLEERGCPSSDQQPDDDDGELDGVPAETYCLWSPGSSSSPAAAVSSASPARCPKSGSTGSVLRWRQRLIGRSHSDGKEKFVFLDAATSSSARKGSTTGGDHGWSYYARGGAGGSGRGSRGRTTSTFLPYKQDLVGLFANAGAFRRSYHPF